jgi:hypothetical protein
MAETEVGTVTIGGVVLTSDPVGYALNWTPRRQVFQGPGGWSTAQDFGMVVGDATLELSSGTTGLLTTAKVQALLALARVKGATYAYTDSQGNALTVLIMDFKPSLRFGGGDSGWWDYSLTLSIRAATEILGVAEV